jgi:hypothetical protein
VLNPQKKEESSPPAAKTEQTLSPFSPSLPIDSKPNYTASLSDFPVTEWDSESDAHQIIHWFNQERIKQGRSELSFKFFQRTTDVYSFDSENDAKQFLELALDILNDDEGAIENQVLTGWASERDPQWTEDFENGATIWGNIAAALAFTVVLIFGIVSGMIVSVALFSEYSAQDWPTGEAQIVEFEEWVETSCSDDGGCSDTQYAMAVFELHCTHVVVDGGPDDYVCGGSPHENADTIMFEHSYESGFFAHAPVHYMMNNLPGSETHTVAYNPHDPSQVDLRPGFQINWEWFLPVIIPVFIILVISKAENVSVKEGFANMRGVMTGQIEV